MGIPRRRAGSGRSAVEGGDGVPRAAIGVQVRNLVRVQQRRAVGSHLAKAAVLRTEPPRNRVLLQDGRDSSAQRVTGQVLDSAVGPLQRRERLLVSLAVPYEVERISMSSRASRSECVPAMYSVSPWLTTDSSSL